MKRLVLDTGPLVALLRKRDPHHAWAKQTLSRLTSSTSLPLATCEAVLVEACFLLRSFAGGARDDDPEGAVYRAKRRPGPGALEHGELLPEHENFYDEACARA